MTPEDGGSVYRAAAFLGNGDRDALFANGLDEAAAGRACRPTLEAMVAVTCAINILLD